MTTLRKLTLLLCAGIAAGALVAGPARAHDDWDHHRHHGPGWYKHHRHYPPPRVYAYPGPVVVAPPPAVVYQPAPVYIAPPPIVAAPSALNVIVPLHFR